MDPLVHRVVGIEPLGVLFVAVEDERLSNEAFADQVEHVHDGRRIAEGQSNLGLELLGPRQFVGLPHIPEIVADRFFDQAVATRLQRFENQILVVASGYDVDDVDVISRQQVFDICGHIRDPELRGAGVGKLTIQVADRDDLRERGAMKAGQVRGARPAASTNNSHA